MKHQLLKKGKVIFTSNRKLDTIFEHQKYHRSQRVTFRTVQ